MIRLTRTASRQIEALFEHYVAKERDEAIIRLDEALRAALAQIEADPAGGRSHPTPYPGIARWGYRWLKVHRYWFAWSAEKPYPVITNVLYDASDMPGRVAAADEEAPP